MNVLDLAMSFGLQPQKVSGSKGGEFASACPFCGGRDRFRIWPDQNSGSGSYWCRQCSSHGDRIQFVMDTQKLGFKAACRVTGDDAIAAEFKSDSDAPYSHRVPDAPRVPSNNHAHYEPKAKTIASAVSSADIWMEKAWKLVLWASEKLAGSDGEQVLIHKGIGMDTAKVMGLGWIPEDVYRPRESWGLSTVIKEETGKPKKLWIPKGLVIPRFSLASTNDFRSRIDDPMRCDLALNHGTVSRLRIRRPEGEPRYYVVPGSDTAQMILGKPGRSVVVVESELDAILLDQVAGDITGIVAMGTSHAKPDEPASRILQDALCILVAMDFDNAGKTSFAWWKQIYPRAVRWPVPVGKDPSDAHHEGCDLRAWVIAGWPEGWRLVKSGMRNQAKQSSVSDANVKTQTGSKEMLGQNHSGNQNLKTELVPDEPESPLDELRSLLKKNPKIKIVINQQRLSLLAPSEWQRRNGSVFARLSRLVYFDPTVFEYLHGHGSEVITIENIGKNQSRMEA